MNANAIGSIFDEACLPEPIHEKINSRPSCANHRCQGFLSDIGNYNFGRTFLTEVSKQKQSPG